MYLVIFDMFVINDENREYYYCVNDNYKKLCELYPNIVNVNNNDINEILIYSKLNLDSNKKVKISKCSKIENIGNGIKIFYENIETIDNDCDGIKRRLYGYLISHGLIKSNENTDSIYAIENINDYNYVKGGKKVAEFQNDMMKVDKFIESSQWKEAVSVFGDLKEIEKSKYWNDDFCVSKLSFALSMLATSSKFANDSKYWSKFFLKVNDRVLELNPEKISDLSVRAYFYYEKYRNTSQVIYFEEASKIYLSLIEKSSEWYKELYRYTKLKQMYFENMQWRGEFGDKWYQTIQDILNGYQKLISEYETLDTEKQIQFKKYYIRSLFGYSSLATDYLFNCWDDYFSNKVYGTEIKDYKFSETRKKQIINVKEYLDKIQEICDYEHVNIELIMSKPSYFDVKYRVAKLYQITGLFLLLNKTEEKEYLTYFDNSNKVIDELFTVANTYRNNKNTKFNYPHYVKLQRAINYYFLNKKEECHRCFNNCRDYMKYEEARIYILSNEINNARQVLNSISSSDKCFNKAQKLLRKIENEN